MSDEKIDKVTVKVEVEIEVPYEDWIQYLTECTDIFMSGYCGQWLRGVDRDETGWLTWEDDEDHRNGEEPDREEALRAWKAGEALPAHWFRLDRAAAIKAYVIGVQKWGVNWFEDKGDAGTYDVVIQRALLGEYRYA